MKRMMKIAAIGIPFAFLIAIIAWVVPAVGQDEPAKAKELIGLPQAEELTVIALDKIHASEFKQAIHALHSAAFILEEGLGMHSDKGPGMGPGMLQMPMPGQDMQGPRMGPSPMMGPMDQRREEGPGRHIQKLRIALERLSEKHGDEVAPLMESLNGVEKSFQAGKNDEARQALERITGSIMELMEKYQIDPGMLQEERRPVPFPPELLARTIDGMRLYLDQVAAKNPDLNKADLEEQINLAQKAYDEKRFPDVLELLMRINGALENPGGKPEKR
ncbi:MAG: hypothetical protein ABIC40_03015 [bacterium]